MMEEKRTSSQFEKKCSSSLQFHFQSGKSNLQVFRNYCSLLIWENNLQVEKCNYFRNFYHRCHSCVYQFRLHDVHHEDRSDRHCNADRYYNVITSCSCRVDNITSRTNLWMFALCWLGCLWALARLWTFGWLWSFGRTRSLWRWRFGWIAFAFSRCPTGSTFPLRKRSNCARRSRCGEV